MQLEAKIERLEHNYDVTFDGLDFDEAKRIDDKLQLLKRQRPLLPTKDELVLELESLRAELDVAKQRRSIGGAKMIHMRLTKIEEQINLEEQAEKSMGAASSPSLYAKSLPAGSDRNSEARPQFSEPRRVSGVSHTKTVASVLTNTEIGSSSQSFNSYEGLALIPGIPIDKSWLLHSSISRNSRGVANAYEYPALCDAFFHVRSSIDPFRPLCFFLARPKCMPKEKRSRCS